MNEVAKVYADALFSLAEETGETDAVGDELTACTAVFSQHPELYRLLNLPSVSTAEKTSLTERLFEGSGAVLNLIRMLVIRGRISVLPQILEAYQALWDLKNGIAAMTVTTPVPLTEEQRAQLTAMLERRFSKTVRLTEKLDPSLLGGVIVDYGNFRMDNSIKTRLQTVSRNILGADV